MKTNPKYGTRKTIRLKYFDYSQPGAYFITICLDGRSCFTDNSRREFLPAGLVISRLINEFSNKYENIRIDEFIIMRDHVHFILILKEVEKPYSQKQGLINQTPTMWDWNLMKNPKPVIGKFVRAFKARVTKDMHDPGITDFRWQRNYYERIIRHDGELLKFRKYIKNNKHKIKT